MAVQRNPYRHWEEKRNKSDFRSRETQASSFVRQMLSQTEYLRDSNRVNPGPMRNTRAELAISKDQLPHDVRTEDMWGWQKWAEVGVYFEPSTVSSNLLEESDWGVDEYSGLDQDTVPVVDDVVISNPTLKPAAIFNYRQQIASTEWFIYHGMNGYPSVELVDSEFNEIEGSVKHLTPNSLRISFNVPVAGYARLI